MLVDIGGIDMLKFIKKIFKKESKKGNRTNQHVQEVVKKTGWTYEHARQQMLLAKEKTGMKFKDYNKYDFHLIPEEKQVEAYKEVLEKKALRKQEKEDCINHTMEQTGWSREVALAHIKDTKERLNITYKQYTKYELFNVEKDKQAEQFALLVQKEKEEKKLEKERRKEEEAQKKLEACVETVLERTDWSYETAKEKVIDACERTGCTPKEYLMYKFYERTPEEQATFYLAGHQKALHVKYAASDEFVKLIRDKEKTNHFFSEYVRRPWCVNQEISFEEFKELFKNSSRVIFKPVGGHCGYGIEAFYIDETTIQEVYDKLATYPRGVVEEYVVQHSEMSRLNPYSVNSLRFVTFSSNTENVGNTGKKLDVAYSIVRIGRDGSIVDNLHSGGMVASVNLETGMLDTHGADHKNNVYITHPDTGTVIKGFKVPYFKEALEMVKDAIATKEVAGYLGWDIAISENGPMLLEVNNRPGADGLSTAYAQEGIGMKHVMDKYL